MDRKLAEIQTVDEYIAQFPEVVQALLREMRTVIHEVAPEAEERISYQMPTFYLNGNLVHFAAYKNHIGFYPAPSGTEHFKEELSGYAGAKGSVQFPLDQPIPFDLVARITTYRAEENRAKAAAKGKKRA